MLDATKHAYKSGRHVEISNLMITDMTDNEDTPRKVADFVLRELDPSVAVHFVRFHPDYRMRDTVRTPIPRLIRAREIAMEMGLEHVYVGNVYDTPYSNTVCNGCGAMLVTRYGLNAKCVGLDDHGHCKKCGRDAHVKMRGTSPQRETVPEISRDGLAVKVFDWHGDVRSLHVQVKNTKDEPVKMYIRRRLNDGGHSPWIVHTLVPDESYRTIIAKNFANEIGTEVALPSGLPNHLHEVFDRAHFPTVAVEEVGVAKTDISPLPIYGRNVLQQ